MPEPHPPSKRSGEFGLWLIAIAGGLGFLWMLIAYFTPHGPIADSWGALLVVISTALMLAAALWLALAAPSRGLRILLKVLIILDIAGTAVCAYFLETYVLLALMVIALIGWIADAAAVRPPLAGR